MRVTMIFCLVLSGWCAISIVMLLGEVQLLRREVREVREAEDPSMEGSDALRR